MLHIIRIISLAIVILFAVFLKILSYNPRLGRRGRRVESWFKNPYVVIGFIIILLYYLVFFLIPMFVDVVSF